MKKLYVLLSVLVAFSTTNSNAVIILKSEKINVTTGFKAWSTDITATYKKMVRSRPVPSTPEDASCFRVDYTECREVIEQPGAILCLSACGMTKNMIFSAASLYSEGGWQVGTTGNTLTKVNSPELHHDFVTSNSIVSGHDIPSWKLNPYFDSLEVNGEMKFASDQEKDFYKKAYLPIRAKFQDQPFVFLGVSNESVLPTFDVLAHEILHSHYFLNETFRNTVDQFWQDAVTPEDKLAIVEILSTDGGYAASDQYLINNEFMAFILQPDNKVGYLKDFVKYEAPLLAALKNVGITPIQMQR